MSDLNDKEIAEQQGKILAPVSLSNDKREIWIKGYVHGRVLGLAVGRGEARETIVKKMLMRNYSVAEISELTDSLEEHIESLGRELKVDVSNEDKILSQKEAIKHFEDGLNTFYKDISATFDLFHDEEWRQKNNGFYFFVTANVNINEESGPYKMEIKYSCVKDQEGFWIDLRAFDKQFAHIYLPMNDHKIEDSEWIKTSKIVLDTLQQCIFENYRYSRFKMGDRRITKLFSKNIMVV